MMRARLAQIVFFVGAALALGPQRARAAEELVWQAAAPGIETVELTTQVPRVEVYAFRIDLQRAELRLVAAGQPGTRQRVPTIAEKFPEHVAINASFFDDKGRAIGAVIDGSNIVARRFLKNWGALVISEKTSRIALGHALQPDNLPSLPSLAVQGIPRLLVNGEPMKLKPQIADRTAVCAQGRYVILVVTGALETTALAELLRDRLHCRDALNLDGGPSTQLDVQLGKLRRSVRGWAVPNALIAIPGK